ncbi:formyltetrahydrofolate deformylase [Steroidobacter sp.]|uniref:formyltetrahydrofolate deformylase n=1 Tax=Steroidobacter sp. TaxID=1978227 RepID=UPI001A4D5343|nr:formyltetrahydrofolate deformylase [Steroidobacter sp.]MBL8266539.1 formyltetrahydrofolate deformylase [Steroidobacter sp.]
MSVRAHSVSVEPTMHVASQRYVLTLSCPDAIGIVAAVTAILAKHGASIIDAQHYREPVASVAVLRIVFEAAGAAAIDTQRLEPDLLAAARQFDMKWAINDASRRLRVLVAVSKQGHCLKSLLHRWEVGTLPVEIVGVVSNHETQRRLVEWHGLPFHHLPIQPGRKQEQEDRLLALFSHLRGELLVLARYMQILSEPACRQLAGCAINIHHSFLPSFKGAQPYSQAHARGVKLIGATAHYVNGDLDEGPIIEQAVERVDHSMSVQQLTALGNEIESVVLNRAIQWHAEHRVFEFGSRTVVLK